MSRYWKLSSLYRASNYELLGCVSEVEERITGHQDQVLPFNHGDTHLLVAI